MDLPLGIYEQIINEAISKSLDSMKSDQYSIQEESIEYSDSGEVLSRYLQQILRRGLSRIKEDTKKKADGSESEKEKKALYAEIEACNDLITKLSELSNDEDLLDWKVGEDGRKLLSIYNTISSQKKMSRPRSSLSVSELFTGGKKDIVLYDELCREIETSDEVYFLVSFIKISGLNLIFDSLKAFTENGGKLNILTTTYMGATEPLAIERLSKLNNTKIRVSYNTKSTRLHAKAYIFKRYNDFSTIFIGSSNLSKAAVSEGMEWNIKLTNQDAPQVLNSALAAFETYWHSSDFELYLESDKERLREAISNEKNYGSTNSYQLYEWYPLPFQKEILNELQAEREVHNCYRNLVVAATGTGKTVISAFDYKRFCNKHPSSANRFLFVAHRKEILKRSMDTFRSILKDPNFGQLFTGQDTPSNYSYLFITIGVFASKHLERIIDPEYFDYIVVDEVHHGAAESYRALFEHFNPKILLGLTATPERMDGLDILPYFNNRVAAEIRLPEAISRELLVPFHYYGVSDKTDISKIKFTRSGFDEQELEQAYINNTDRMNAILKALNEYQPYSDSMKALGFCVSKKHAKYMSECFNEKGIASIYLTSDSTKEERDDAPNKLRKGEIKIIFTVDLYNEGVDIPEINTLLLLRPTESLTIFIQQLGRGLRKSDGKSELIVLDFIGQFDKKYKMYEKKLRYLTSLDNSSVRTQLESGFSGLPPGCSIKLEEMAKERIYESIKTGSLKKAMLIQEIREYVADHGSVPTLQCYLKEYDHSLFDIYRHKMTFTRLCAEAKNQQFDYSKEAIFAKGLGKLQSIDSKEWINRLKRMINRETIIENDTDRIYALMLYYSFFDSPLEKNGFDSLQQFLDFVYSEIKYREEISSVLRFNENQIKFVETDPQLDYECGLKVYCSYYTDQIFAGIGKNTEYYRLPLREGVYFDKERNTDVLLINLNKSEKDFSPTTMYEDYAISDELFHWQTQSKTTSNSETGKRYIEHEERGSNVLLFVRENKTKNNMTAPYMFLGKGHYVSSEGNRPMNIIWKLDNKMPVQITSYSPVRG